MAAPTPPTTPGQTLRLAAAARAQKFLTAQFGSATGGQGAQTKGAELLRDWSLSSDLVAAVRFHHAPSKVNSPGAGLLHVAEAWTATMDGVACDLHEYAAVTSALDVHYSDYVSSASKARQWEFLGV